MRAGEEQAWVRQMLDEVAREDYLVRLRREVRLGVADEAVRPRQRHLVGEEAEPFTFFACS